MGRYTTSKQGRTHGGYTRRLRKRGLGKAPSMPVLTAADTERMLVRERIDRQTDNNGKGADRWAQR